MNTITTGWPTLTSVLRARAAADPDGRVFTFLANGSWESHLTYGELDRRARATACRLWRLGVGRANGVAGQWSPAVPEPTVLVTLPAGFDFLCSFFGCLYAGAIAVPTRYPHPRRPLVHVEGIAADSGAHIGLTTREMQPFLADRFDSMRWLVADDVELSWADDWEDPGSSPDDVAYLQYTSGSTSTPKGVIIYHRNVWENCDDLARQWGIGPEDRILSWVPHFHDMGLVFGLLTPLYAGCPAVFMPPMVFAQRPLTWLEAISRYRVTHSTAPNFAYENCSRVPESQLAGLDLSCWRMAANGAEPVRADTVERFIRRYEAYGFSPDAMCPGYGLAENTLMATTSRPGSLPVIRSVDAARLREGWFEPVSEGGRATRLAASGTTDGRSRVLIVDPDSLVRCQPGEVGEIWIAGPSVTGGYWRRPDVSARKFAAHLADTDLGPFLRTGDLGAVHDGHLFVLGRSDDLIIIRGANYAPEDLELAIGESDPALEPDGGAAFAVELLGEPRLVVAQEVRRQARRDLDRDRVVRSILRVVSEQYELEVSAVVLLGARTLPRTSSGKKQRHACRRGFLDGTLEFLHMWVTPGLVGAIPSGAASAVASPSSGGAAVGDRVGDVLGWLREYAARRLDSRLMDERRSIPPYVVLDLGNHGVLGLQAPAEYGGLGLDHRGLARVLEQLAAIDLTLASFVAVHNGLGLRPILRHATAARRDELAPALATGRVLGAFAVTEPGAGSDVRSIAARARPAGRGGWSLWGTKVWSGSASWAGVINTFVQLEGSGPADPRGITGFVLRQGSPGLRMGPEALTMGLRGMVQNEVRLEGVRVTADDLLGPPGEGMAAATDTMEFGRFCMSALGLGVMKRCLQLMARHAGRRRIATGRLLDNPVTLVRLSELTAAAAAVEALMSVVAGCLDGGRAVPAELYCACKVAGPELAWRAADELMQQLGGRGYVETNLAPQILRDARIMRIFEGPTEPMTMHIGSRLVHDAGDVCRFLSEELGQPELAAELAAAAERIRDRCVRDGCGRWGYTAARRWSYMLAGEVGVYGLLLASVVARSRGGGSWARAEEWARRHLDGRLAEALGSSAAESVLLDAGALEELVSRYAESIGDVEQWRPGEQQGVDELLRREESAGPVVEPVPDGAACGCGAGEAAGAAVAAAPVPAPVAGATSGTGPDFTAWLTGWVSTTFARPESGIRPGDRFSEHGMDSVTALMLTNSLESWLGVDLPPTVVWDHPTIGDLAGYLSGVCGAPAAEPAVGPAVPSPVPSGAGVDGPVGDEMHLLARVDDLPEEELRALLERLSTDEVRE